MALLGDLPLTAIPGIHTPLTIVNLEHASDAYNSLPGLHHADIATDTPIDEEHIKALRVIIRKHSHGHGVAVHNLHRHDPIPERTIRLELAIDDVFASNYRLVGANVVTYEFASGKSPVSPADLSMECVAEVFTYIITHGLEDTLALQLGNFPAPKESNRRIEIEVDGIGTLMLPREFLNLLGTEMGTGWTVAGGNPETVDPAEEVHLKPTAEGGTHKVKWVGKDDHEDVANISPKVLVEGLKRMGIINV